ncbi:MAG: tetratricopeptide repeat protein [Verrucomicrobiota bacterium]|jgi:TPR repeat protein
MSLQATINSPVKRTRQMLTLPLVLTGVFVALGFFSRARTNPHLAWTYAGVAAFLLCWQLALFLRSGRKALGFAWEFVPVRSHYIQALVQLSIYAYWGWYWRNVYAEAPLILSQVVFLYIFDALLTWSRGQTWRLGFGPWPIIFSTNLFMWFRDDWFVFQFLMVALGVLGKQFIRWQRDGKLTHIFNPSALALTIISLILIFTGTSGYTWGEQIAITQGLPPHLYSEIFLCGLVVQYFFSVTLLTFSAAAVIGLLSLTYTKMTGVYLFVDSNIPIAVFLGLHLLMTDPATTPRSSLGKIIFGGLYGAGVFGAVFVLNAIGAPGFYDKLIVVPILNLLTPLLDRVAILGVAGKFGRWEKTVGPRKMNLAFMGGWTALFLTMLATGFVEAPHPGATIAFWEKAAEENRPHAAEHLRLLLYDFDRRDLNDRDLPVAAVGINGSLSREQVLGILCNQVASIYAAGKFVPADHAKAAFYFEKACEFGNTEGCANLAIEYFRTNLDGAQVDIGRALSTLEQSGAVSNNGRICFLVGYAYDTGRGRPLDKAKARQFYEKGAVLGELAAWKNLARMQLAGEGGPPDHAAAALWLQKAADAQDGISCLYLARMYHNGDGVPQDEQKAVALLEKACSLGVESACLLLQQNQR